MEGTLENCIVKLRVRINNYSCVYSLVSVILMVLYFFFYDIIFCILFYIWKKSYGMNINVFGRICIELESTIDVYGDMQLGQDFSNHMSCFLINVSA